MPVTADYEFSYKGLLIGNDEVELERIQGLHGYAIRDGSRASARGHGNVPARMFAEARALRLKGYLRQGGLSDTAYAQNIDDWEEAFAVDEEFAGEQKFYFTLPPWGERWVRGRPLRKRMDRGHLSEGGLISFDATIICADPRMYEDLVTDSSNTGTFNVTNSGTHRAYPILKFVRGAGHTAPSLVNNATGESITFTGLPNDSSDLTADMDGYIRGASGLVIKTGASTNQYGEWDVPRTPFYIAPGVNSLTLTGATNVDVDLYPTFL